MTLAAIFGWLPNKQKLVQHQKNNFRPTFVEHCSKVILLTLHRFLFTGYIKNTPNQMIFFTDAISSILLPMVIIKLISLINIFKHTKENLFSEAYVYPFIIFYRNVLNILLSFYIKIWFGVCPLGCIYNHLIHRPLFLLYIGVSFIDSVLFVFYFK